MAYTPEFISAVEEAQRKELSELRNEVCENLREIARLKSDLETVTAERDSLQKEVRALRIVIEANIEKHRSRAEKAEAERDQWRADAERLAAHVENLMDVYQHPDAVLCCSGQMCGCYGATKHQEAEHYAKEALATHNKLKGGS